MTRCLKAVTKTSVAWMRVGGRKMISLGEYHQQDLQEQELAYKYKRGEPLSRNVNGMSRDATGRVLPFEVDARSCG